MPGASRLLALPAPRPIASRAGWALAGIAAALAYAPLLALAAAAAVLSVAGVGVPVLAGCLALGRALAGAERDQAAALLGVQVAAPGPAPAALRGRLADAVAWRALAWLALRCVLAGSAALLVALCALVALAGIAVPFDAGWLQWSGWSSPGGPLMVWTLLLVPVAAAAALAGLNALAAVGTAAAPRLLGGGAEAQVAALTRRTAQLGERARLAAQLHDSVGHTLTATTLQAAAARSSLDRDPAFAREALAAIERAGRRALEELDAVLGELADDRSADARGLADLDEIVAGLRAAGLPVTVTSSGTAALPAAVDRAALRVVQEGATNVLRHAGTPPTAIELRRSGAALVVAVTNGPPTAGTPPRPGGGRGLRGLRALAASLGGELDAGALPDGGYALTARLPLA